MKHFLRLALVCHLVLLGFNNLDCHGAPELTAPEVTAVAVETGDMLRLSWTAVPGARGYYVAVDDSLLDVTAAVVTLQEPAESIAVAAYSGDVVGEPWTLVCRAVVTELVELWAASDSDPARPNAFGFQVEMGTCVTYGSDAEARPELDFVLDDTSRFDTLCFFSPNQYLPTLNDKDNAAAEASGTDFHAEEEAKGRFSKQTPVEAGGIYYLWIDPKGIGWDTDSVHFAKAQILTFEGTKATMITAYQRIPGLKWLATD